MEVLRPAGPDDLDFETRMARGGRRLAIAGGVLILAIVMVLVPEIPLGVGGATGAVGIAVFGGALRDIGPVLTQALRSLKRNGRDDLDA